MPTAEQAKAVVERYDIMPKDSGGSHGAKRPPSADYSTLVYPVYLPILTERAQKGDGVAITTIGEMPFPDATKTLVEEWAAKEKVDVTIDYIPSQGMKNLITIAAESPTGPSRGSARP